MPGQLQNPGALVDRDYRKNRDGLEQSEERIRTQGALSAACQQTTFLQRLVSAANWARTF